jgi:hypothetical protein
MVSVSLVRPESIVSLVLTKKITTKVLGTRMACLANYTRNIFPLSHQNIKTFVIVLLSRLAIKETLREEIVPL